MDERKCYSNVDRNIKLYYYSDYHTRDEAGSLAFTAKTSDAFPGNVVSEIHFPNQLGVGQEVVLPAIVLKKGEAVRLVFHSDAMTILGNCMIEENTFEFPARERDVTWYLKFVGMKEGEVVPYISFQRLRRSWIPTLGLAAGFIGALGTLVAALIDTVRQISTDSSASLGPAAIGGAIVLLLSATFWTKLSDATKKWQELTEVKQQPHKNDASPKIVGKGAIRITKEGRWPTERVEVY